MSAVNGDSVWRAVREEVQREVAGVPAEIVGRARAERPALEMDHSLPNGR